MYSGYCDLLHKASLEREVYCTGIISFNEKRFAWPLIFNTKRLKQEFRTFFFFFKWAIFGKDSWDDCDKYCTVNRNKNQGDMETLRLWSISCKVCDDCIADVLKAVLCSCCLVRPSSIRALVLPRWALSQSTSLTVHTFSNAKRHPSSSTYSWNLTLQSINFICGQGTKKRRWNM